MLIEYIINKYLILKNTYNYNNFSFKTNLLINIYFFIYYFVFIIIFALLFLFQ